MRPGPARPFPFRVLGRLTPFLMLGLFAALIYFSGVREGLAGAELAAREAELRGFVAAQPVVAIGAYVLFYAVATASFMPVGILLMLTSGFLFGPWIGAAASTLGATLGACLTYGSVRMAFSGAGRRFLQRKPTLARMVAGFDRNAFTYLISLRLIPLSPFALVNVAAGVAAAPFPAFLAATLLGEIPPTLIYCHLGVGVGQAASVGRPITAAVILQPQLFWPLLGLALLSLAPVALRARRAVAQA